jgi:predicted GNAT family acetyltransferase
MTKPDRRGKGYAEILRAKCYEILREQEKDTFYSFTDQSNKPALKFKEKIGAEIIGSYLFIKLWGFKYVRYANR